MSWLARTETPRRARDDKSWVANIRITMDYVAFANSQEPTKDQRLLQNFLGPSYRTRRNAWYGAA